jgi:hypothetical protein
LPTLAPLVNEVTPAVVNISVITRSPLRITLIERALLEAKAVGAVPK